MSACKSLLGYCPYSRLTRHKTPFSTLPAYRLCVCWPSFPFASHNQHVPLSKTKGMKCEFRDIRDICF